MFCGHMNLGNSSLKKFYQVLLGVRLSEYLIDITLGMALCESRAEHLLGVDTNSGSQWRVVVLPPGDI